MALDRPRSGRLRRRGRDRAADSGRVRVLASNPPYDPNLVPDDLTELNNDPTSPLLNRATQGQYPPGSTFKVVTAAAALDSGTITPDTTIDAPGHARRPGPAAQNDFDQDFGPITLDDGADQLGQHLVRPARRGGRRGHAVRVHGRASASARSRRSTCPTTRSTTSGVFDGGELLGPRRPDRHRPGRDRPGAARGDAAADGRGRGDGRQRRQADEAADLEPGRRPRRPRRPSASTPPSTAEPIDEETAAELTDGDGRRGQRGHRDQRGDPRGRRRRQDRHRGDARSTRPAAAAATRTRPGSSASRRPTTRRSRSRRRSSAPTQFGGDVAAPIFRDVAEAILNGG